VAVAGSHVAWIVDGAGNTEAFDDVYESSLSHPSAHDIARSDRMGDVDADQLAGSWLSAPVADGGEFAYATWTTDQTGASVSDVQIHGAGGGSVAVSVDPHTWVAPQAGDSGLLVALTGNGAIAVLDRTGALVRVIHPLRAPVISTCRIHLPWAVGNGWIGLRKGRLAFITSARTLDVYDSATGALVHSFPVPATNPCNSSRVDLYYGYAMYSGGYAVHLVKLATGRDRVLARSRSRVDRFALEAPGAVYVDDQGLRFVPFARLRELVG
jgi:hypothetical protein